MTPAARKTWLLALRLAVVAVIYALIARSLQWDTVLGELTAAVASAVLVAAGLNFLQACLGTARWARIGSPLPGVPPLRATLFAYLEGMFVNQALPSSVGGDAWRAGRWREWGVRLGDAVTATLADRVYGAFGAACLAAVAIVALWPVAALRAWLVAAGVIVGAGSVLCVALFAVALRARGSRTPPGASVLQRLVARIAVLRVGAGDVAFCIATALAGHALAGAGALVIARHLGIDSGALVIVSVASLVTLLAMVPVSLAGWGVREASYLVLLVPLGVPAEKAVLLGVAIGLQGLLASLPGGVSILAGLAAPRRAP